MTSNDPDSDDVREPGSDLGTDAADVAAEITNDADRKPASVGENDIAWPIPEITMVPLAIALSVLMLWSFGRDWVLVSVIPFVAFLSAMIVIDLRELRIPDKLTRPAALLTGPLLALALLSDWTDISLVRALLGAAAMGAFYFLLFFIYPAGMGFGDVKLAPIIGAHLGFFGWIPEVRGLFAAYLIVGPVAVALLIFGGAKRDTGFPFGPFMAAGAIAALVLEAKGI